MQASMIHHKLKQHFPYTLENVNPNNFTTNITQYIHTIINQNLPHLPIEQLHNICRKQEKHVMNNLIEIKNVDIYEQIANVCPMHRNLKQLSNEEVTRKITHYNQVSNKQYELQSLHSQSMMDLENQGSLIDQLQMNEVGIEKQNHQFKYFEDQDQNGLLWEDNQMYCLNEQP